MHDLLGHRADEPAAKEASAAMSHHNMVDRVFLGILQDLFGWVADRDRKGRLGSVLGGTRLKSLELPLVLLAGAFDYGLGLHFFRRLRWPRHRQHVQLAGELARQRKAEIEGTLRRLRSIISHQNVLHRRVSPAATVGDADSSPAASAFGSR